MEGWAERGLMRKLDRAAAAYWQAALLHFGRILLFFFSAPENSAGPADWAVSLRSFLERVR